MNIYQFMSSSPWLTFFLAYFICRLIWLAINRLLRTINICKNGYPPPHCDADGDFKSHE